VTSAKAKTIHVDFLKKAVLCVEEVDYKPTIAIKRTGFGPKMLADILAADALAGGPAASQPLPEGTATDPGRYLEASTLKFEELLDASGCFDDTAYGDPQTFADAMQAFQILQREIPMLVDTMEVLRDIIEIHTGHDPAAPNRAKSPRKK
jgi:hypothetical protein